MGSDHQPTVDPLLDAACAGPQCVVLDLASGPSYVAAAANTRGAVAIGFDIAEPVVRLAQELHPVVTFRRSEAEQLPFTAASFDAVVGDFLVNHLAAPEAAIAEASRVLKPGGHAAFTVWGSPNRARFIGVVLRRAVELRRARQRAAWRACPEAANCDAATDQGAIRAEREAL